MMSKDISDCTIREATLADHDDILAIREDAFDGLDYVSTLLEDLLRKHTGYVALVDNKIVAFCLVHLVDDDQTMVLRALRVHKNHEGKGIIRHLKSTVEKYYKERGVLRKSFTFSNKNLLAKFREQKKNIVFIRSFQVFDGLFRTVMQALDDKKNKEFLLNFTTRNTPEILLNIFESEGEKHILFPDCRLVYDWLPLRLMKSNLCHIDDWACVIESRNKAMDNNDKNLHQQMEAKCSLISIGNVFLCPRGLKANVDFYGSMSSIDEIYWHLQQQFSCWQKKQNEPKDLMLSLILITDNSMTWANSLDLIFEPLGLTKRNLYTDFSACFEESL